MSEMKRLLAKLTAFIPVLAMVAGIASLNSACIMIYHQPEISTSLDKYRK
jgi:cyclic lactone autoinducer peptide